MRERPKEAEGHRLHAGHAEPATPPSPVGHPPPAGRGAPARSPAAHARADRTVRADPVDRTGRTPLAAGPARADRTDRAAPPGPALRVLLAGGGTGGHLYPGLALVDELRRQRPGTQVVLAGTGRPAEQRALDGTGFGHADLGAAPFPRRLRSLPGFVRAEMVAIARAARLVRRFRPDLVIGLGGYASLPSALLARGVGIPLFLLEQNAFPGRANRLLARVAEAVFASFPDTAAVLPGAAVELLGNPVRLPLLERIPPAVARAELGLDPRLRTLLIVGGSQGARGLNRACAAAAPLFAAERDRVQVLHLAGAADADVLRDAYACCGARARVFAFRTDMATCYAAADLVLARAGGTTIAEVLARGLPSVLVPFPAAAEDHQTRNARSVAASGAALVIPEADLDEVAFADALRLCVDEARLWPMQAAARSLARPDAARVIARRVLERVR